MNSKTHTYLYTYIQMYILKVSSSTCKIQDTSRVRVDKNVIKLKFFKTT